MGIKHRSNRNLKRRFKKSFRKHKFSRKNRKTLQSTRRKKNLIKYKMRGGSSSNQAFLNCEWKLNKNEDLYNHLVNVVKLLSGITLYVNKDKSIINIILLSSIGMFTSTFNDTEFFNIFTKYPTDNNSTNWIKCLDADQDAVKTAEESQKKTEEKYTKAIEVAEALKTVGNVQSETAKWVRDNMGKETLQHICATTILDMPTVAQNLIEAVKTSRSRITGNTGRYTLNDIQTKIDTADKTQATALTNVINVINAINDLECLFYPEPNTKREKLINTERKTLINTAKETAIVAKNAEADATEAKIRAVEAFVAAKAAE
jgi:hypothetical protein